jgi:hypothetical protein
MSRLKKIALDALWLCIDLLLIVPVLYSLGRGAVGWFVASSVVAETWMVISSLKWPSRSPGYKGWASVVFWSVSALFFPLAWLVVAGQQVVPEWLLWVYVLVFGAAELWRRHAACVDVGE